MVSPHMYAQHTRLPGEELAADTAVRLAKGVMTLDEEIAALDRLIECRFREHPHATVLLNLPAIKPKIGAAFLAATGGDMAAFGSSDRLAGFAGLAPAPLGSGRISGNLRGPRRFNRSLLRVFYLSFLTSLRLCPASKTY
jgi:transposase